MVYVQRAGRRPQILAKLVADMSAPLIPIVQPVIHSAATAIASLKNNMLQAIADNSLYSEGA